MSSPRPSSPKAAPTYKLVASLALIVLGILLFAPAPAFAAAEDICTCVCNCPRNQFLTLPGTNEEACNEFCLQAVCAVDECIVTGVAPTPRPAGAPPAETGVEAVRARLKGIAGAATGLRSPPSLVGVAGRVVRVALVLVGLVFFTLVLYGGFMLLTAGGNEEQVKKSKQIIGRAIVGVVIVLFAGAITQFITGFIARPVVSPEAAGACPRGAEYDVSAIVGGCDPGYSFSIQGTCICN